MRDPNSQVSWEHIIPAEGSSAQRPSYLQVPILASGLGCGPLEVSPIRQQRPQQLWTVASRISRGPYHLRPNGPCTSRGSIVPAGDHSYPQRILVAVYYLINSVGP